MTMKLPNEQKSWDQTVDQYQHIIEVIEAEIVEKRKVLFSGRVSRDLSETLAHLESTLAHRRAALKVALSKQQETEQR